MCFCPAVRLTIISLYIALCAILFLTIKGNVKDFAKVSCEVSQSFKTRQSSCVTARDVPPAPPAWSCPKFCQFFLSPKFVSQNFLGKKKIWGGGKYGEFFFPGPPPPKNSRSLELWGIFFFWDSPPNQ